MDNVLLCTGIYKLILNSHSTFVQSTVPNKALYSTNIKKRLLLRYIHHFKSDLINNMDNMLISGTEPSLVNIAKYRS